MTRGLATSRLQGLEDSFKSFQSNHSKILHLKDLDKTHAYFSSKMLEATEDMYYYRRGDFNNFVNALDDPTFCPKSTYPGPRVNTPNGKTSATFFALSCRGEQISQRPQSSTI